MATDYCEVLKELRAEEKRLVDELEIIRGMIPGAELMAKRMPAPIRNLPPLAIPKPVSYAGMGPKMAILELLGKAGKPLMPADITRLLLEGGIQTRSNDFAGTVGTTLTQLKSAGLVERKDEGWVTRLDPMGNPPMNVSATSLRAAIERLPLSSQ
jgi:hypothetical protein